MKTLAKNLDAISLFEREKFGGKYVRNKCGRDFLYYALNYYYPEEFNNLTNNPLQIEQKGLFGTPVPAWLAWTQIQFRKVPELLQTRNLQLSINNRGILSYADFVKATLFSRMSFSEALREIEKSVDNDTVSGIDISIGLGGLLDHVMFVYGYDAENVYVIDTHKVKPLNYKEIEENKLLFALPVEEVRKRWTRFGRVWKVAKI